MRYFELSEDTKPRITKTLSPSMTEIAQSQGFNVSKIWYHGTTRRFTSFRNAKEGRGVEELGSGIYLTGCRSAAYHWARNDGFILQCYIKDGPIYDHSKKLTDEMINHLHAGHSDYMTSKFGDNSAYDLEMFKDMLDRVSLKRSHLLKKIGYIGAIDPNSQIPDQIVIFDPANVFIAARVPGSYKDR